MADGGVDDARSLGDLTGRGGGGEDQQGAAIAACKKDAKASYDKAKTTARQTTAADTKSKS